jgi:BMFP domain-containing protein YqiC
MRRGRFVLGGEARTLDRRRSPVKALDRRSLAPGHVASHSWSMTQTTGRFFDELGKLITDAAGAADGVRKEIESVVRAQAERVLRDLDIVQREDFEAVKAMAQKAREENELLKERIAALEAAIVKGLADKG